MAKLHYRLDRIAAKLSPQKRHTFYNKLKKISNPQDKLHFIIKAEVRLGLKSVYDTS